MNIPKKQTPWQSAKRPRFRKVAKSRQFDAIVIGGGITGLTTAYHLKRAGKRVGVVERYRLGYVDTGLTTAHLTIVTDKRLTVLVRQFGEQAAALTWQAGAHAIDVIETTVKDLGAQCEFRRVPGYLHESLRAQGGDDTELQEEAELARRLGFSAEFERHVPYFNRPGIRFSNQAKFHPLKYLAALAKAVHGDGSMIFEQSEVTEIKSDPQRVVVGPHELEAEFLMIATHVPLAGNTNLASATLFQSKLCSYSSYVLGAKISKGLLPDASFWDTTDPYYYLRVEPGKAKDYAIFGGEDHKTGQEKDNEARFAKLREMLQVILPEAKPDRQWSGQVIETADGLPYLGETAKGQFVATGFNGNGITFGTVGGLMARDAMLGQENPWTELFSPHRGTLRGGPLQYLQQNVDYPYYLLKDRLSPISANVHSLARGEGRIVRMNNERVACARDKDGTLHAVSAICTHMGCQVQWNNAEQTWDCPCHGSRFKPSGEVIAGPAESPLEKVDPVDSQANVRSRTSKAGTANTR